MNNAREFPAISADDEVFDEWVLELVAELRRRRLVSGPGIAIDEQPSGTVVRCTFDETAIYHAKTQSGGIAAATSVTQMTSGTVDLWTSSATGALTSAGATVTAWNKAVTSIAGSKHIMIQEVDGLLTVVWEACP